MKSAGNHGRASRRTRVTGGSIDPSNVPPQSAKLLSSLSMQKQLDNFVEREIEKPPKPLQKYGSIYMNGNSRKGEIMAIDSMNSSPEPQTSLI